MVKIKIKIMANRTNINMQAPVIKRGRQQAGYEVYIEPDTLILQVCTVTTTRAAVLPDGERVRYGPDGPNESGKRERFERYIVHPSLELLHAYTHQYLLTTCQFPGPAPSKYLIQKIIIACHTASLVK